MFSLSIEANALREGEGNTKKGKHIMRSYNELLSASIAYIKRHGKTQATVDKLESFLPAAWSASIIADALDSLV